MFHQRRCEEANERLLVTITFSVIGVPSVEGNGQKLGIDLSTSKVRGKDEEETLDR